jgi:hypothetical protein
MNLNVFHPTRRALIRGLLLASGFAPAMLAALGRAGANSKVPVIPGVQQMHGDVRINDAPARLGQMMRPGDVVRTGAGGDCVIIIGQHAYMIREHSEIEFFADDFVEDENGKISGAITMLSGGMLSVFGRTQTDIVTPFATVGIRGTACYIEAQPQRTYACVCYGHGELSGTEDGTLLEKVVTTHHDSPRFIYPKGSAVRIEEAKVIDHTDAELRMLEALVNRKPPFDNAYWRKTHKDSY